MAQVIKLKSEIKNLSLYWFQAIYEVDGLLDTANNILNSFKLEDWENLANDLTEFDDIELQILADAIMESFESYVVQKCQIFGRIFILIEDSAASFLFNHHIDEFFGQIIRYNAIDYSELLACMKVKVAKLKSTKYVSENSYSYFVKQIKIIG